MLRVKHILLMQNSPFQNRRGLGNTEQRVWWHDVAGEAYLVMFGIGPITSRLGV